MDPTAERAFGDFVVARSQALCRFAFLLCGDWHRAEDAMQTAFTKLYLRWDGLDASGSVDAYVRPGCADHGGRRAPAWLVPAGGSLGRGA